MDKFLVVAMVTSLGLIAWQDFKERAVWWFLFPLMAILCLLHGRITGGLNLNTCLTNLAFFFCQLLLLQLYWLVRHGHWLMQGEQYLGWGDVLFLLVLCFCFSPINFLLFNVISCFVLLLLTLLFRLFARRPVQHIPLAGGQALCLLLLFVVDLRGINLYVDTYFLHLWGLI